MQWTYGILIDHDRIPNGSHQFRLRTTLSLTPDLRDPAPSLTIVAPAFTSTVSNPVSFSTWNETIVGSSHTFQAFTPLFPANWQINIYDVEGILVRGQSGTTTDGSISWAWDLRDSSGILRTDYNFDPLFDPWVTISPSGGSGGAGGARPAPVSALDYPDKGSWIVAYQDKDHWREEARVAISNSVTALRGGPSLLNIPNNGALLRYGTFVDADPATAQTMRNDSWLNLRALLTGYPNPGHTRNFYYLGHGAARGIGGDIDDVRNNVPVGSKLNPGSKAFLQSDWVRRNLTRNRHSGPRPYRFVFLDGCSTANGDWPDAFGIGKTANNLAFYQNPSRKPKTRPSSFVGWAETIYYSHPLNSTYQAEWGDYQKFANFRSQWMSLWSSNPQFPLLHEALDEARRTSNWINSTVYNRAVRIFGYRDLKFNEYNRRTDWQ